MPLTSKDPEVTPDDVCGGGYFLTGSDDPFIRACQVHDWQYEDHHLNNSYARKQRAVDRQFAKNIDRLVKSAEILAGRPLPLRRLRGWFYKNLVFLGGRFFW